LMVGGWIGERERSEKVAKGDTIEPGINKL